LEGATTDVPIMQAEGLPFRRKNAILQQALRQSNQGFISCSFLAKRNTLTPTIIDF
jgi:hypothetical protein